MKERGRIVVSKNGPYLVSGKVPLSVELIVPNNEGLPWDWKEAKTLATDPEYKLCRCGESKKNPFCDDACKSNDFDGTETAIRKAFVGEERTYDGPTVRLQDSEGLCAHARFCMAAGKVWNLVAESDKPEARELAIREANHCPSGRLVVHDSRTGQDLEEPREPSIFVVEDLTRGCSGPLWIRGAIRIESEDGTPYEARNRAALCRCGNSENKPFCNGNHRRIRFRDGLADF